jgi:dihydrofolate reductase
MLIRANFALTFDGFSATAEGRPAILAMPGVRPGISYDHEAFLAQCDAVAMGRTTFEPALTADRWPWPGKRIYVLTSRPLRTEGLPGPVVACPRPQALVDALRDARLAGDVHLLGGPATIHALLDLGAVDRLEVTILPVLLGEGLPFARPGVQPELALESQRAFEDGAVQVSFRVT